MSRKTPSEWLLSHRKSSEDHSQEESIFLQKKSLKIAISSGKGGVGKTSFSLSLAKKLANDGKKTLLIDCDFNLSNTRVKLGLPLDDSFYKFVTDQISFFDSLYQKDNFYLMSACNGEIGLFEGDYHLGKFICEIVREYEHCFDVIIFDCPAGISKEVALINSFSDQRIVLVTPDKSSITDSYSLIKILSNQKKLKEYHLVFNKISSKKQYERLTETFLNTASNFLDCRLKVLGGIEYFSESIDRFDRELFDFADSKIKSSFHKVINTLAEKNVDAGIRDIGATSQLQQYRSSVQEQEVLTV